MHLLKYLLDTIGLTRFKEFLMFLLILVYVYSLLIDMFKET